MGKSSFFTSLIILMVSIVITGCNGGSSSPEPITPQAPLIKSAPGNLDTSPVIAFDGETALGVMGGYNLTISSDGFSAELVPMRTPAIGEAYIVSGLSYFTITPCADCLKIKSVALDVDGNIVLGFVIKHPFPKGNTSLPPSASNRLDLDVFDLALLVKPLETTPVNFALAKAYSGIILNADGYTNEIAGVIGETSILPYKICYENQNNNRFEMGTDYQPFDVTFSPGSGLTFDLYLTMGYGASAKRLTRLTPTYYVPEFNRKAAWKVNVGPVTWNEAEQSTVNVEIYDWNHGATIATEYPDPYNRNYIKDSSDVLNVTIEVPSMTNSVIMASLTDPTTNDWDDPLTYSATFSNEKGLAAGNYTGIVKVADSRVPGIPGASDSLIHQPAIGIMEQYEITEFATYQTFGVTVLVNHPPVWDNVVGIQSATPGNATITVTFGTASDPDGDNPVTYDLYYSDETATSNTDPFSSPNTVVQCITSPYSLNGLTNNHKYWLGVRAKDSLGLSETNNIKKSATSERGTGNLSWVIREGGIFADFGLAATTLSDDSTVVSGYFSGPVTFSNGVTLTSTSSWNIFVAHYNPDLTLTWVKQGGKVSWFTNILAITTLSDNSTVLTGSFMGTSTFGPGELYETVLNSAGDDDIFIARYNTDGTLAWAKRAGGIAGERGLGVTALSDNSTVVTGYFWGTATFGPGEPNQTILTTSGHADVFVARYNPDGTLAWAKRAGGGNPPYVSDDIGYGITTLCDNSTIVTGYFWGAAAIDGSAVFGQGEPNETTLYSAGAGDIFIAKYNSNGTLAWAKRAGGTNNEGAFAITVLSNDSIVITGEFQGSATFGKDETNQTTLTSAGQRDIFVAEYNTDGTVQWASRAGGTSGGPDYVSAEHGIGITALSDNSTVITGAFQTLATFGPGEANQTILTSDGYSDIFIARYNPDGTLNWAKRAGGIGWEEGKGITSLSDNTTILIGCYSYSATFGQGEANQTTLDTAAPDHYDDIFIAHYSY